MGGKRRRIRRTRPDSTTATPTAGIGPDENALPHDPQPGGAMREGGTRTSIAEPQAMQNRWGLTVFEFLDGERGMEAFPRPVSVPRETWIGSSQELGEQIARDRHAVLPIGADVIDRSDVLGEHLARLGADRPAGT
jgi:hypothetical protein